MASDAQVDGGESHSPASNQALTLSALDGPFAICKLPGGSPVPDWALAGDFTSITRTPNELSIVCAQALVPAEVSCEPNWRCLRVAGSLPFSAVGVLAALTAPLAKAGVSVFAISTFETDYLLVKAEALAKSVEALRRHGHVIHESD